MPSAPSVRRDDPRLEELVQAAHEAAGASLVVSTSGNFSVRLDSETMAISRARARLGRLEFADLIVVDLARATSPPPGSTAEDTRPSRETPMHAAVYKARADAGAVLHFQALAATTVACRGAPLPDLRFIPEVPVYVRKVGDVPYLPPGSDALASAVAVAFEDPDVRVVQLRNHGQIVVGDSPEQAVERATFFELACRIWLLGETRGPPRIFSTEELEKLWSY